MNSCLSPAAGALSALQYAGFAASPLLDSGLIIVKAALSSPEKIKETKAYVPVINILLCKYTKINRINNNNSNEYIH
jgi:hypothetical protein